MNKNRILMVLFALVGVCAGAASTVPTATASGSQQCYYDAGIDPENSCTTCSQTCLGDAYQCCDIVVDN